MIRNELVDIAILVSFGLGMANQYNHLRGHQPLSLLALIKWTYAGFPHGEVGCLGEEVPGVLYTDRFCYAMQQEACLRQEGNMYSNAGTVQSKAFHVLLQAQG
jgi:hypothetical protein